MNTILENTPSAFALLVDKLKDKSEEELKLLSLRLFSKELANEWASITADANFENSSEDEIVAIIMKNRYQKQDV